MKKNKEQNNVPEKLSKEELLMYSRQVKSLVDTFKGTLKEKKRIVLMSYHNYLDEFKKTKEENTTKVE